VVALRAAQNHASHSKGVQEEVEDPAAIAELEAECCTLQSEVISCEQQLDAERRSLPIWAQRCVWRDELDARANQLERISLQFDSAKRSLDGANEELQWQATSAEALRMRLADVLCAAQAEETKTEMLKAECRQGQRSVEELLAELVGERQESGEEMHPSAVRRLREVEWLMETIRACELAETYDSNPPP